jgi:3-methyladenine DNA glycosylase AlkD
LNEEEVGVNFEEMMKKLEELGSEQTKNIYANHGVQDSFFGVKIGDLKKLVKYVKKDHQLALALFNSGNHDAMYLAGLSVNPKLITKETLQDWVEKAHWYMLAEYTVAGVAAESNYALELAREWMESENEMVAVCGWNTYANYISITPDEHLDLEEIRGLLRIVESTIHEERNRVRYVMNQFVICVGAYVLELHEEAMKVAVNIGKVHVNVGNTACKVPLATEYIHKIAQKDKLGKKKKTAIC